MWVISHVRSFMSNGIRLIETARSPDQDYLAAFACLAIGMEQLLKMTVGLVHVEEHGQWLDLTKFKHGYSHKVSELDQEVRELLERRRHLATHRPYIEGLGNAVENDSTLPLMIAVLTDYGSTGRYVHLDALADPGAADTVQMRPTPLRTWEEEVEEALVANDPAMMDAMRVGDSGPLNRAAGACLRRWYDYIGANWTHGVAGERAQRLGPTLQLDS